jgi:hypothetical protein
MEADMDTFEEIHHLNVFLNHFLVPVGVLSPDQKLLMH